MAIQHGTYDGSHLAGRKHGSRGRERVSAHAVDSAAVSDEDVVIALAIDRVIAAAAEHLVVAQAGVDRVVAVQSGIDCHEQAGLAHYAVGLIFGIGRDPVAARCVERQVPVGRDGQAGRGVVGDQPRVLQEAGAVIDGNIQTAQADVVSVGLGKLAALSFNLLPSLNGAVACAVMTSAQYPAVSRSAGCRCRRPRQRNRRGRGRRR